MTIELIGMMEPSFNVMSVGLLNQLLHSIGKLGKTGTMMKIFYKIVATGAEVNNSTYSVLLKNLLAAGNWRKYLEEFLDEVTEIDLVVNLKLREDVLVEKCLGRRICSQCGKGFNVTSINAKAENGRPGMSMDPLLPPSHCASKLITRADDTEEIVKSRLHVYQETSKPVEDFYRDQGKLMEFDLPGGIPESWPKLLEALNLDEYEDKRSAMA